MEKKRPVELGSCSDKWPLPEEAESLQASPDVFVNTQYTDFD